MRSLEPKTSLSAILSAVADRMAAITFDDDLQRYCLPAEAAMYLATEPYYKGLAAGVQVLGARRVLDFGTLWGASAVALAKWAELVVTCDVDLSLAQQVGLFDRNIRGHTLTTRDECLRFPLDGFNLIFVDLDHDGLTERRLHERFGREYRGLVFYDDIDLNGAMREFWNGIETEKAALDWHHSGFGVVAYPGPSAAASASRRRYWTGDGISQAACGERLVNALRPEGTHREANAVEDAAEAPRCVDVVVLSYAKTGTEYDMTSNCLRTLRASEANVKFDVVVVETAARESVAAFASGPLYGDSEARVAFPAQKFNYNAFLQIAYRHFAASKSEHVYISNNDVVFGPGFATALLAAAKDFESVSPWFPKLHDQVFDRRMPIHPGFRAGLEVCGWGLLIRKSVFDVAAFEEFFPEDFPFWFQDDYYALQLRRHGLKHALVRDAVVTHLFQRSHHLIESPDYDAMTVKAEETFCRKVRDLAADDGVRLTIGVLSVPSRMRTTMPDLADKLMRQAEGKPVEVVILCDNKVSSIGTKRNSLVRIARGDFLTFVDDDDDVSDDYVASLVEAIAAQTNVDCIVFDAWVTLNGDTGRVCHYGIEHDDQDAIDAYFRSPNHICCVRTALARQIPFDDVSWQEDTRWSALIRPHIKRQVRVDRVLYRYRYDSAASESGTRSKIARVAVCEKPRPCLSLAMIVRNSSRTLAACLAGIRNFVDEMIVVDTGSIDDTRQIARAAGAKVYEFPWCDDFATARNESLKHATGDWIFWMDSDDTIDANNGRKLHALARRAANALTLGYVMQVHCPGTDAENDVTVVDHVKMVRNIPELRFEGRIHEQLLPSIRRLGGDVEWTDIFVTHSGSDRSSEGRRKKLERDLRLLELDAADRPDHPFVLFNFGMTLADAGRHIEAVDSLVRCLAKSAPSESHVRKAYALLVASYSALGSYDEASRVCEEGLRAHPDDPELTFRKGIIAQNRGRLEEAERAYRTCLNYNGAPHHCFRSVDSGITGFKSRHNLAVVYGEMSRFDCAEREWRAILVEKSTYRAAFRGLLDALSRQNRLDEARSHSELGLQHGALRAESLLWQARMTKERGDLAAARQAYWSIAREFPNDEASLRETAEFLFWNGDPAETEGVLGMLTDLCPDDPSAHFNLGTVCVRRWDFERAADEFRESLSLRPGWPATLNQLAFVLDKLGRHSEAAAARLEAEVQQDRKNGAIG